MKKIPTLFKRAHDDDDNYRGPRPCTREIRPGCEWVLEGLGMATEKVDGSACLLRDGKLFKRYARRPSEAFKKKYQELLKKAGGAGSHVEFNWEDGAGPPPERWEPADNPAPRTGLWPGWLPVNGDDPADKWHVEAFSWLIEQGSLEDGTYELVGPKVEGNSYGLSCHQLWKHGAIDIQEIRPVSQGRTFESIRQMLKANVIEGIVFHYFDGDAVDLITGDFHKMAKIKRKDLGLKWPCPGHARSRELTAQEKLERKLAEVKG